MKRIITCTSLIVIALVVNTSVLFANTLPALNIEGKDKVWEQLKQYDASTLRAVSVTKLQLDSVVQPLGKDVFVYDANGNVLINYYYKRTTLSSPWTNYQKFTFTYDANNNQTNATVYNWSSSTSVYVGYTSQVKSYDANNRLVQDITKYWDSSTSLWINYTKYNYSYDVFGNGTQRILTVWDSSTSTWVNYEKVDYTYNANNKYVEITGSGYNDVSLTWEQYTKITYTYDVAGNLTLKVTNDWDEDTSSWTYNSKYEYSYDANNNKVQEIGYAWNGSAYVNSLKYVRTYDAFKNEIQYIRSTWNTATSTWKNEVKRNYTYDTSYSSSNIYYQLANGLRYNYKLNQVDDYSWNSTSSNWDVVSNTQFSYSGFTLYVSQVVGDKLKVFVAYGKLSIEGQIEGKQVAVFNLQGVSLFSERADSNSIEVALPIRSVYVVRVGSESVKVIY